jgi:hypothetical protein
VTISAYQAVADPQAVAAERARQVRELGYTAKHDQRYTRGELVAAALAYLTGDPRYWPWPGAPRFGPRDAVKAAALLRAEQDRLARAVGGRRPADLDGLSGGVR